MTGSVWCLREEEGKERKEKRFAWLAGWLAGSSQVCQESVLSMGSIWMV